VHTPEIDVFIAALKDTIDFFWDIKLGNPV
jgi:hypothetical protein